MSTARPTSREVAERIADINDAWRRGLEDAAVIVNEYLGENTFAAKAIAERIRVAKEQG